MTIIDPFPHLLGHTAKHVRPWERGGLDVFTFHHPNSSNNTASERWTQKSIGIRTSKTWGGRDGS
jgi:hypothetical protein